MAVYFFNTGITIRLRKKVALKKYLASIFLSEGIPLSSLTYIFCSDEYLLQINHRFLRHEDYTDIITFSLESRSAPKIGEIYISAERVKENASSLAIPFHVELHRVIFHGALHLCGYNDKTSSQKKIMRQKEDSHLKKYGLI